MSEVKAEKHYPVDVKVEKHNETKNWGVYFLLVNANTTCFLQVSKCFLNPSASIIYIKKAMQPCLKKYRLPGDH
jgi:hypothetical protein